MEENLNAVLIPSRMASMSQSEDNCVMSTEPKHQPATSQIALNISQHNFTCVNRLKASRDQVLQERSAVPRLKSQKISPPWHLDCTQKNLECELSPITE